MKVALVRGQHLNRWEMQNYEPLTGRVDMLAFAAIRSRYPLDGLRMPVRRLACPDSVFAHPPILRAAGALLLRTSLSRDRLIGLEHEIAPFDVVHSAETYLTFTVQAASAKAHNNQKLMTTCWETIPFANGGDVLTRGRKQYVQQRTDLFVAMSRRAANALRAEGVQERRIRIQYPGVDLTHFRPLPRAAMADHGLWRDHDKLRVLFVGRIDASKGVRELLLAAADLAHRPHFAGMVEIGLVGDGDTALVRHMVRLLGLHDVVSHRATVPYADMPSLYASTDVFVLPSIPSPVWEEQFGMVLAESMACGKAVVSTHSGAIPEVIGDAGVLVPPYDATALADAIADLLVDDRRRCSLSRRALDRAQNTFDACGFADRLYTIYEELLA